MSWLAPFLIAALLGPQLAGAGISRRIVVQGAVVNFTERDFELSTPGGRRYFMRRRVPDDAGLRPGGWLAFEVGRDEIGQLEIPREAVEARKRRVWSPPRK